MVVDENSDATVEDRPGGPSKTVDWNQEWDGLAADGRLRRYKRNVHYLGSPERLMRRAQEAAQERDRGAVVQREQIGKWEYLWVQFLDGEMEAGEPCPRCRGTEFQEVQGYFLRCVACRSLYPVPSDVAGPAAPDIVEFAGIVVRSLDGEPLEEMTIHDEAVVEASWRFLRPVTAAQASFNFAAEGRKSLRSGCPDVVDIADAQIVRFALYVDDRVLAADRYSITASLDFEIEPDDSGGEPLNYKVSSGSDKATLKVSDPRSGAQPTPGDGDRSRLHWNVSILADSDPDQLLRRPDPEELVEFVETVVRSPEGRPIDSVGVDEGVVVDTSWRFLRPLTDVFPTVVFDIDGRKVLRSTPPKVALEPQVVVPAPQIVRFRLAVDKRVLEPGVYSLETRVTFMFEPDGGRRHVYEVKSENAAVLEVRQPGTPDARAQDESRSRLCWSIEPENDRQPSAG